MHTQKAITALTVAAALLSIGAGCARTHRFTAAELARALREGGADVAMDALASGTTGATGASESAPGGADVAPSSTASLEVTDSDGRAVRLPPGARLQFHTDSGTHESRLLDVGLSGETLLLGARPFEAARIREIVYRRRRLLGFEIAVVIGSLAFLGGAALVVYLGQQI